MTACKNCGEQLEGDGYTKVQHCPNAEGENLDYAEPDAEVIYCELIAEEWLWCANWCKEKGVSPFNNENWKAAEDAYRQQKEGGE